MKVTACLLLFVLIILIAVLQKSYGADNTMCPPGQGGNQLNSCKSSDITLVCSGRGVCECGQCKCDKNNYGDFCECNDTKCPRTKGLICSGNGYCQCSNCVCKEHWDGQACQCSLDVKTCQNPSYPSDLCSSHGECICGQCKCESTFYGAYCEDCPTCPGKCDELRNCIECKAHLTGPYDEIECFLKCKFNPIMVSKINDTDGTKICKELDKNDCFFVYSYDYDTEKNLRIYAEREKRCPKVL